MKIAVSADGQNLGSQISPVFGRCPCFIIAEVKEGKIESWEAVENSATSQTSGAGTASAQLVGDKDVSALISGGIGPKAFSALKKWNIDIYIGEPGSIEENIQKLTSSEIEKVESPTSSAGMGMNK